MSSACSTSEMFCFNVVLNVLYWVSHCGYHCFLTFQTLFKCQVRVLLQRCFVSMSCSMSCIGCRIVVIIVFNLPNTLKYQVRVLLQRCFVSMSCSMSCIGCRIVVIIYFNLPNTLKCQVRVLVQRCFVSMSCSMSCIGCRIVVIIVLTCQTLLNVKCVFYFRDVLFQCRAQCLVLGVALWLSLFFNLPNTLKCQVRVLLQRCFVSMSCSMSCIVCDIVVIIVLTCQTLLNVKCVF